MKKYISVCLTLFFGGLLLVLSEKELFLSCPVTCIECKPYTCCEYKDFNVLMQLYVNITCDVSSLGSIIQPHIPATQDETLALSLHNSCLSVIPDNICDFPKIQVLILKWNNIKEVSNLSCLKELVYLDVSFNKIEILRTGILDSLKMLSHVDFSNNQIIKIQLGVFHTGLDSIQNVYLQNNELTEADLWCFNITHQFCKFDLRYNKITKFVNEKGFKLDLSETLGPGTLDVKHNKFVYWPDTILKEIGNIGILLPWKFDFRNNFWFCDCRMYSLLLKVHNFVSYITGDFIKVYCHSPDHLKGILVTDVNLTDFVCNVTSLCPPNCFCQNQPALSRFTVDCRNLNITVLPVELPDNKNLFLLFQNNSIDILQDRSYLKRTIYLDISNNNLSSISSEAIDNLIGLNYLNLENNKLKYLPENIQNLRTTEINICNNKLICSCSDIWLFQWFDSEPNIKDINNITCSLSRDHVVIQNINKDTLNCEYNLRSIVFSIILGTLAFIIILVIIACIFYRYEILTLYYLISSPKLHQKTNIEHKYKVYDVFISCNENEDHDRNWVQNELLSCLDTTGLKSYFSFRDGLYGEITIDKNIKTIHNSNTVIAVISESYVTDQSMMFELNEVYHHMIKKRNGRLIIIKRGDFQLSLINNGYIRSLFKLDKFIESDDVDVFDKLLRKLPEKQLYDHFEL